MLIAEQIFDRRAHSINDEELRSALSGTSWRFERHLISKLLQPAVSCTRSDETLECVRMKQGTCDQ
jgi:hypothetical protein